MAPLSILALRSLDNQWEPHQIMVGEETPSLLIRCKRTHFRLIARARLAPTEKVRHLLPHREIACAIMIDTFGRLLLQRRDDVIGIVHPGKVSLFGGHREANETYLECVVREIYEEISYYVPAHHFEHLATLDGSNIQVDGGTVRGEFFIARSIPADLLVITEGSLLIYEVDEVNEIESELTPSARFAIYAFLRKRVHL